MDEQYIVKVRGYAGQGTFVERMNGERVTGTEYDRIIEMLQEHRTCFIYLAYGYRHKYGGLKHKIGFSIKPYERLTGLGLGWLHWIPCPYNERRRYEEMLQGYFIERHKWLGGEWFDLSQEDVDFVESLKDGRDIEKACESRIPWGLSHPDFRMMVNDFKRNYQFPKAR